jgi:ABC-2 type transport system permease protein
MRDLLWAKFWTGTLPLLVLAVGIVGVTNVLLQVSPFMFAVSVGTITLMTFAIAGLAIGFGTMYPRFESENAAQIPTSFGGLVFMMTTVALLAVVIVLEASPVYAYLQATRNEETLRVLTPQFLLPLVAVVVVCGVATALPLRIGLRRMEEFEF